jgi:DNA-binding NarL/FixJ family response regulator
LHAAAASSRQIGFLPTYGPGSKGSGSVRTQVAGVPRRRAAPKLGRPGEMIRVLVADDHRLFVQGLRRLMEDDLGMSVVVEAGSYAEVIQAVRTHALDVAVLDLSMPGRDGAEMIAHVKSLRPSLKIVVMTMHDEFVLVTRALRAGADAYMLKGCAAEECISVIRQVACGGRYVSPGIAERIVFASTQAPGDEPAHTRLTDREYKVFQMLIAGKRGAEIAQELSLSEKTVSAHKVHVLRKMNLSNRTELVVYAIKHQLVQM